MTETDTVMVDALARQILSSAKYSGLDGPLVHRVAGEAAQRFRDRNQALKYAKRKLHQAFGAFLIGSPAQAVTGVVEAVRSGRLELADAAMGAMAAHVSTAERIDWLVPFYEQVELWCGRPSSVLDLACGLNPLAIPWMRLAPDVTYWACEIDRDLVAALALLQQIMPVRLTTATCDLITSRPALRADVALLLKTVPTLEQQRAGASGRVLTAIDCQHVILSLPRRSLTGRRGYSGDTDELIATVIGGTRYVRSDTAELGSELLCHLVRADHPAGRGGCHDAT
jgi:16S rRNA (guanine(1405)-N(7))-methyltransferase